jgi:hypothetical protein
LFAKKIYGPQDCESERELMFWNEIELPFIYFAGELFDAENHENAKALASIIKYYNKRRLPLLTRYSIEGSTLARLDGQGKPNPKGNVLAKTICRKIAVTVRPANQASISSLVTEANVQLAKSEATISSFEMNIPQIELEPFEMAQNAIQEFSESLHKALTLGSGGGSPTTAVGGSALSKEDLNDKNFVKCQVLAALRDWDKLGTFKQFLKNRLPDADENVLNRFSEMADTIFLKSNLIKKSNIDDYLISGLSKLNSNPPSGSVVFRNQHVIPGKLELTNGPYQGSKLKLLFVDDKYVYVQPPKAGDQKEVKINKINRKLEGTHFIINQPPVKLNLPNYIDGVKHSNHPLIQFQEQKVLIHGLNLAEQVGKAEGSTESRMSKDHVCGWYRNSLNKSVYLKPSTDYPDDGDGAKLSSAQREVIFHNLMNRFFGLGDFVPTTAIFTHPETRT